MRRKKVSGSFDTEILARKYFGVELIIGDARASLSLDSRGASSARAGSSPRSAGRRDWRAAAGRAISGRPAGWGAGGWAVGGVDRRGRDDQRAAGGRRAYEEVPKAVSAPPPAGHKHVGNAYVPAAGGRGAVSGEMHGARCRRGPVVGAGRMSWTAGARRMGWTAGTGRIGVRQAGWTARGVNRRRRDDQRTAGAGTISAPPAPGRSGDRRRRDDQRTAGVDEGRPGMTPDPA
jgi:hypothetical protein